MTSKKFIKVTYSFTKEAKAAFDQLTLKNRIGYTPFIRNMVNDIDSDENLQNELKEFISAVDKKFKMKQSKTSSRI